MAGLLLRDAGGGLRRAALAARRADAPGDHRRGTSGLRGMSAGLGEIDDAGIAAPCPPPFVALKGEVRSVERLPAQRMSRVLVRPIGMPALPSLVRVNLDDASMPAGVGEGAIIAFRTRLMPPAPPSLPGGYDFARRAYFEGIGATGRALPPVAEIGRAHV